MLESPFLQRGNLAYFLSTGVGRPSSHSLGVMQMLEFSSLTAFIPAHTQSSPFFK